MFTSTEWFLERRWRLDNPFDKSGNYRGHRWELSFPYRMFSFGRSNHGENYWNHLSLLGFCLGYSQPIHYTKQRWDWCEAPCFGAHITDEHLCLELGKKRFYFTWPWANWTGKYTRSYMHQDGSMHPIPKDWYDDQILADEQTYQFTAPYHYLNTHTGEVETVQAVCHVEQSEWRLKHFPFINKVRRYLDVRFNSEVGPRKGSWKGGVVGCSEEIKRFRNGEYEDPRRAFHRMMGTRRFER